MRPVNEIIDSNNGRSYSNVHRMSNLDREALIHRYIEHVGFIDSGWCVWGEERARSSISRACLLNFQSDASSGMATIKHRFPRWNKPTERKAVLWKWSISWRRSEARSVWGGGWETRGMWSVKIRAVAWRTGSALPLGFVGWRDGRRWSRPVPIIHTSPSAQIRT